MITARCPESLWRRAHAELVAGVAAALRISATSGKITIVAYFDQQQRPLRRRRGAHPRGPGRQDRQDRAAAERVKITFSVDARYQVPADAKAAILSPSAGHRARHPADAGLHRWTGDGRRSGDPAGPHGGAGGVGRLAGRSWRS